MTADGRSSSEPQRRSPAWKSLLLRLLDTRPRGWWRAQNWAAVFVLILMLGLIGRGRSTTMQGISGMALAPTADGGWKVVEAYRAMYSLSVYLERKDGVGWTRWSVANMSVRDIAMGTSTAVDLTTPGIRPIIADRLLGDQLSIIGGPEALRAMLDTGRMEVINGRAAWMFWRGMGRLAPVAVIGLCLCALIGFIRGVQAAEYRRRLKRLGGGHCGLCNYDLKGTPAPVCPECGASIQGTADECRRGLGIRA